MRKKTSSKISRNFRYKGITKSKVGIQIGERAIKIVELTKHKGRWKTKQKMTEPLPKGIVEEGKILQPERLGLKIKELFVSGQIRAKKVSVFVEEFPFFIRNVQLPKMSKKELKTAISYHAQLEIPVNINELTITYFLYGEESIEGNELYEYILFAVHTSLIEKIAETVRAAGLSLYTIGFEPEAIYHGLKEKQLLPVNDAPFLIVRPDTHRLLMAIYSRQKLVYSRYVPFALDKTNWVQEIQRTLVSWNGRQKENVIKEVLIMGERDEWEEVKRRIEGFMPLSVRLVSSPYTACLGIALKEQDKALIYSDPFRYGGNLSYPLKISIPLLALAVTGTLYFTMKPYLLQRDIDRLEEQLSQPHSVMDLVAKERQLRLLYDELLTVKKEIEAEHLDVLSIREAILSEKPEDVQLIQMVFSKEGITLNGNGANQQTVVRFFKGLQRHGRLGNVNLSHSAHTGKNVQFTIEINGNFRNGE